MLFSMGEFIWVVRKRLDFFNRLVHGRRGTIWSHEGRELVSCQVEVGVFLEKRLVMLHF